MSSVTLRAPAKINLHLRVGPLRSDGFHELDTVYRAVSLCDTVTLSVDPAISEPHVSVSGPYATGVPCDEQNLAYRAACVLAEHVGVKPGVRVHIEKRIPHAAGLAGGSADAAATLVACNTVWNAEVPRSTLLQIAAELGSDVPFAVLGGDAEGASRGEVITPLHTPETRTQYLLVVMRGSVSTPEAFAHLDRVRAAGVSSTDGGTHNDFHDVARALCPEINSVLHTLHTAGVESVSVSGSGPTLLGVVRSVSHGEEIARTLRAIESVAAIYTVHGPVPGPLAADS